MRTSRASTTRTLAILSAIALTVGAVACTSLLGDLPAATIAGDASADDDGGDANPDATDTFDTSLSEAAPQEAATSDGSIGDTGASMDSGADADAAPTCVSACVSGTTQCAQLDGGTAAEKCETLSNGCTGWVDTNHCSSMQSCVTGDAGAACVCQATECTVAGPVCQSATTLATCAQDSTTGCLYVAGTTSCSAPESCSGKPGSAACSLQCSNSCPAAGAKTCVNGGVATCTMQSNGCLAYGTAVACAGNQTCTVSGSSASCICNNPAACDGVAGKTCTMGTSYVSCTADSNGCLVAATHSCAANQTCSGGAGSATCSCVNPSACQGATGETCTSSTAYVTCTHDANGCLVESGSGTCSSGQSCTGGTPGSEGCTCDPGYTLCASSCVSVSSDPHNCGACGHDCKGGTCSSGICQPWTVTTMPSGASLNDVATDGTSVYLAEGTASGGSVLRMPLAGGASSTVYSSTSASIATMAYANGWLVFGMSGGVGLANVGAGGTGQIVQTVSSTAFETFVFIDPAATHYFYSYGQPSGKGSIAYAFSCALTTTVGETCDSTLTNSFINTVDNTYAFGTVNGTNDAFRMNYSNDTLTNPGVVAYPGATDGTYVYFTLGDPGSVYRTPEVAPSFVAGTAIAANTASTYRVLATDGKNLFFSDNNSGALGFAPVGGGATTVFTAAGFSASRMDLHGGVLVFQNTSTSPYSVAAVVVP